MKVLWCLHGNLQQPIVWRSLSCALGEQEFMIESVNLWADLAPNCWSWAEAFCHRVRLTMPRGLSPQHYLLGYSLGGRLAFHALLMAPDLWSGAIVVSADPGSDQDRQKSLARDRIWAYRFLTEPWEPLLADWDALPVFCGYPCPTPRPETDFKRQDIATAFKTYSKGHMDHLTPRLRHLSVPITYVTGKDDRRYGQLGQTLDQQCPHLTHVTIEGAGHRVPWEQPQAFQQALLAALGG